MNVSSLGINTPALVFKVYLMRVHVQGIHSIVRLHLLFGLCSQAASFRVKSGCRF